MAKRKQGKADVITTAKVVKKFAVTVCLFIVVCLGVAGFKFYRDAGFTTAKASNDSDNSSKDTVSYDDMSSYTICLDAGHGGSDTGISNDGRTESEETLELAKKIQDYLEDEMNFNVVMTREDDTYVEDNNRAYVANTYYADALISIHRSSYVDSNHAEGFESWIYTSAPTNSTLLSDSILDKLNATDTMLDGTTQTGTMENAYNDYPTNSQSNMASCVLMMGYMTSSTDNEYFDNNLDEYAKAIAEGIYEYVKEYYSDTNNAY